MMMGGMIFLMCLLVGTNGLDVSGSGLEEAGIKEAGLRSTCDQITYSFCRMDEGNFFQTDRLKSAANVNQELCQNECTLEDECNYYVWENNRCSFMRDPNQYFDTCRDVAAAPTPEFARCHTTNYASGCSRSDIGAKKLDNCVYDGEILERMEESDGAAHCEAACRLRNFNMFRTGGSQCEYFIYNSASKICQLLGETEVTCYRELGPAQEKGSCMFDGVIDPVKNIDLKGSANKTGLSLVIAVIAAFVAAF